MVRLFILHSTLLLKQNHRRKSFTPHFIIHETVYICFLNFPSPNHLNNCKREWCEVKRCGYICQQQNLRPEFTISQRSLFLYIPNSRFAYMPQYQLLVLIVNSKSSLEFLFSYSNVVAQLLEQPSYIQPALARQCLRLHKWLHVVYPWIPETVNPIGSFGELLKMEQRGLQWLETDPSLGEDTIQQEKKNCFRIHAKRDMGEIIRHRYG